MLLLDYFAAQASQTEHSDAKESKGRRFRSGTAYRQCADQNVGSKRWIIETNDSNDVRRRGPGNGNVDRTCASSVPEETGTAECSLRWALTKRVAFSGLKTADLNRATEVALCQ